ncbi:SDR family NAD(P)-dependent oxidoreductase [Acinetobacter johnsonii]|uniref:SDR family NAD(P)-dependent oxidoreductase n=1 Tax=Acinetobacter johnsonii TaxID=40214 RepID=UPI002446CFF5|nr:SDR family NAD(P)-dependent oxidoreductase [Acinetobacter johnsonii]MDH1705263.1 SDR family oxidoreductase [Acinetobacter johnsonii]
MNSKSGCIVITGSSKGIGLGLAQAFLEQQQAIVISGRNSTDLHSALQQLQHRFPAALIHAVTCDVTQFHEVQTLWDEAIQQFGAVQIWINNAGSCTATLDFKDLAAADIQTVVQTNILGSMFGSQVALNGMLAQGYGQIFNMEGWGTRGEWSAGMTTYATTKRAVGYFSQALFKETKQTHIQVGTLSPGMVATDLLVSSWQNGHVQHWNKMKRLFFFIIDPPEVVCRYLAQRILENKRRHSRIVWMTPLRLLLRFLRPYYWQRNPIKDTALAHLHSK